jgi:hypothetical protein
MFKKAVRRESTSEVAPEGYVMLMRNGTNFIQWKQRLHEKLKSEFSTKASFLLPGGVNFTRQLPTAGIIQAMYPGTTAADREPILASARKDYYKLTIGDVDDWAKIFGKILLTIPREVKAKIEKETGWANILSTNNCSGLVAVVTTAISSPHYNLGLVDQQDLAMRRFNNWRQSDSQELFEAKESFDLVCETLATVRHPQIPPADTMARQFMRGLDQARYGEYMTYLANKYRTEGVAYPTTVDLVFSGASTYVGESKRSSRGQPMVYATNTNGKSKDLKRIRCYKCKEMGHYASNCGAESKDTEEPTRQGTEATTAKVYNSNAVDDYSDDEDLYGFTTVASAFVAKVELLDSRMVFVDSLASDCFGCNWELARNIETANLELNGVGGKMTVTQIGNFPCFGRMLITPKSKLNAIPLSRLENYEVIYEKKKAIKCNVGGVHLYFKYFEELESYGCIFDDKLLSRLSDVEKNLYSYMNTRSQHMSQYPRREREKAIHARELSKRLWWPSDASLTKYLNNGGIINTEIMGRDVILARSILGPDEAVLKGKTTDSGPPKTYEPVYIPASERKEQICYVDIFDYRGKSFMLMKMKPLQLIMTEHIDGRQITENFVRVLNRMISKTLEYGFVVEVIVVDPARALSALVGKLRVAVEVKGARTHVVDAERDIRMIKERLRCNENSLGFKVPRRLVPSEVTGATIAINSIPRGECAISPREIFRRKKTNYAIDLRIAWGDYAQVEVMPSTITKNGPLPRTVAAIALFPTGNKEGTYMFYDIYTEQYFTGTKWTALNLPDSAIKTLNDLYDRDEKNKVEKLVYDVIETIEEPLVPNRREEPIEYTASDCIPDLEYSVPDEELINNGDEGKLDEYEDLEELGYKIEDGVRKSHRITKKQLDHRVYLATKMSLKKALNDDDPGCKEAVKAEMRQMVSKGVFAYLHKSSLTPDQLKSSIRSSMFITKKHDAKGIFQKWKARLVAGGDGQEKSLYENVSSPTVAHESVTMMLAAAAITGEHIATADVTGAYLECDLDPSDEVIMKLDDKLVEILMDIGDDGKGNTDIREYRDSNGVVYVKLLKALYGCIQSSRLWYKKLTSILADSKFTVNKYDPCVYHMIRNGARITLAIHVDDLLITSREEENLRFACDVLKENFNEVTIKYGEKHSYLAMNIEVTEREVTIDMTGYIEKFINSGMEVSAGAKSPATDTFFDADDNSPLLDEKKSRKFHTDVAKLLYLAKRCRVDILTSISYLASRVKAPSESDNCKLNRVVSYLINTKERKIKLKRGNEVSFTAFIDASFGSHEDGRSRSGVVIFMAGAAIAAWSSKQKMVAKSSTESEILALSDGLTEILWMRYFLKDLGYNLPATVVYQDNKSVLTIMKEGRRSHQRTKHLNVRYFLIIEKQENKEVELRYCPSEEMYADLMTKPISGAKFECLSAGFFGESDIILY